MKKKSMYALAAGAVFTLTASTVLPGVVAQAHAQSDKINLVLTIWGSELDTKTYQERVNQYMKLHPNVSITVKNLPNYDQQLETMIAGGEAPDIVSVAQDAVGLGVKGALLDLTPYIKKANINVKQRFAPGYIGNYTYRGQIYGLPDRGGFMVMYFNKTMFDKAHVGYPTKNWTWADFLKAAQKLTIRKGGKTVQWGIALDEWNFKYESFIHQNGGSVLNANETKSVINQPAAQQALQFYHDLMYKWKVAPSPYDYANMGSGVGGPDALFGLGRAAMMITGLWNIEPYANQHLNFGLAPLPHQKQGGMESVGTALAVCSQSQHPDVAFDVINYLTTFPGQRPIVSNDEDVPATNQAMKMWINSLPKGVDFSAVEKAQNDVFAPLIPPVWNEMQNAIGNDLAQFWNNKMSVKQATDKAAKDVDTILARGQ